MQRREPQARDLLCSRRLLYSGKAIGIDLGTTYSCVGIWRGDHDRVDIITNEQGNRTIPSMVVFTDNERLILLSNLTSAFGHFLFYADPTTNLWSKLRLKQKKKTSTAEEISSMVLLQMKEIA